MIDVESVLASRLITANIAAGNVVIADQIKQYSGQTVVIEATNETNLGGGLYDTSVTASCIANDKQTAHSLAFNTAKCLDEWGGSGIKNVEHTSTIPVGMEETAGVLWKYVVLFRVLHQEMET